MDAIMLERVNGNWTIQRTKAQTTMERIVQRNRKMWYGRQIQKTKIEEWKR
jgi:hypothetical protein